MKKQGCIWGDIKFKIISMGPIHSIVVGPEKKIKAGLTSKGSVKIRTRDLRKWLKGMIVPGNFFGYYMELEIISMGHSKSIVKKFVGTKREKIVEIKTSDLREWLEKTEVPCSMAYLFKLFE